MKTKIFQCTLAVVLMLSFQSCGSSIQKTQQQDQKYILTEDNYVNLAKFHYQKESVRIKKNRNSINNNHKFRSYPGAKPSQITDENHLKIKSITPFDEYIESLEIAVQNRSIKVFVKNKLFANISLYENDKLIKNEKQTMNQFINFEGEI